MTETEQLPPPTNPFESPPEKAPGPPADATSQQFTRVRLPGVKPYLGNILIGINVAAFLATLLLGTQSDGQQLLFVLGQKDNAGIVQGEYWRLITPIFLHVNLIHLLFNSYVLYILGPPIERTFGYARFLIVYIISGIAGVVASFAFTSAPSIGASGAIFGLVGAQIVYLQRNRSLLGGTGRYRMRNLIQFSAINLFFGFIMPGIDNWGHIGGLLGGAAMSWMIGPLFALRREFDGSPRVEDTHKLEDLWWVVILGGLVLAVLTAIIIFARINLRP